MTKIKMCGLRKSEDIEAVNEWKPDYAGFVFAPKSKRYVTAEQAAELKDHLDPQIQAVGVFVDEAPERVAALLNQGVIELAQLHGSEDEEYLVRLRELTLKPVIQAFRILSREDVVRAMKSSADEILLDSGAGTGSTFNWEVLRMESGYDRAIDAEKDGERAFCTKRNREKSLYAEETRPYFLAGGLNPQNVTEAIRQLHPYAVDVSSGIETDGSKDREKIAAFVTAVRKENNL